MTGYLVSQGVTIVALLLVARAALRRYTRETETLTTELVGRLDNPERGPDAPALPPPAGASRQARELLPLLLKLKGIQWRADVNGDDFRLVVAPKRKRKRPGGAPPTAARK